MGMSMGAMQAFESLRVAAERDKNRALAGNKNIQSLPAPANQVFEVLEDLDRRMKDLEKANDDRGVVLVGDPGASIVAFVAASIDDMSMRDVPAAAIRALMGRVLWAVERVQKRHEAEAVAAAKKNSEWLAECKGGAAAAKEIADALRAMMAA